MLDLGHDLHPGMHTHTGLSTEWEPGKTRQGCREASGTAFQIDRTCAVGNSGICLGSPNRRYAARGDHSSVPLSQVVNLLVVVVDGQAPRAVRHDISAMRSAARPSRAWPCRCTSAATLHSGARRGARAAGVTPHRGQAIASPSGVPLRSVSTRSTTAIAPTEGVFLHVRLLGVKGSDVQHRCSVGAVPGRSGRLHAARLTWHGVGTRPLRACAMVAT